MSITWRIRIRCAVGTSARKRNRPEPIIEAVRPGDGMVREGDPLESESGGLSHLTGCGLREAWDGGSYSRGAGNRGKAQAARGFHHIRGARRHQSSAAVPL